MCTSSVLEAHVYYTHCAPINRQCDMVCHAVLLNYIVSPHLGLMCIVQSHKYSKSPISTEINRSFTIVLGWEQDFAVKVK